jgi:uncharacterized protein (TIGR02145 family)
MKNLIKLSSLGFILILVSFHSCAKSGTSPCGTPPSATTTSASFATQSGVTLNGTVDTYAQNVKITFEFGKTLSYGETVYTAGHNERIPSSNYGLHVAYVHADLAGLSPCTTYHYRIKAVGACQTTNGEDVSFTTLNIGESGIIFNPNLTYGSVSDNDGNIYKTIQIGTQAWLAENLKTTEFNDGTTIPLVIDTAPWKNLTTPAYCWYNNDSSTYKATIGALYNWFAVNTGKLCPTGWHLPTHNEWTTLTTYLGSESVAGGKLKETGLTHWKSPNSGATNETGFTALPGGVRFDDGSFLYIGYNGNWWSSVGIYTPQNYIRIMSYDSSSVKLNYFLEQDGFSVRCLRDY